MVCDCVVAGEGSEAVDHDIDQAVPALSPSPHLLPLSNRASEGRQTGKRTDHTQLDVQADRQTDGWKDGRTGERASGRTDGQKPECPYIQEFKLNNGFPP